MEERSVMRTDAVELIIATARRWRIAIVAFVVREYTSTIGLDRSNLFCPFGA